MAKRNNRNDHRLPNLKLEEAALMFRPNFSGKPTRWNAQGDRDFTVRIPIDIADDLYADGWPVKFTNPRDDDDPSVPYMKVKVKYGDYPPQIYRVADGNAKLLNEKTIGLLDSDNILYVDAEVRAWYYGDAYPTSPDRGTGYSAYVVKMYVVVEEDWLGKKYNDVSVD